MLSNIGMRNAAYKAESVELLPMTSVYSNASRGVHAPFSAVLFVHC